MDTSKEPENVLHAREEFFKKGTTTISCIRPEILKSWMRSKNAGVDPDTIHLDALSPKELETTIRKNQMLFDTALPIMEVIYNFVKGSGFVISLTDRNGIVLKMLGDETILKTGQTQGTKFIEGSNRSESVIGTNGIGTPIATHEPIQLSGAEHYYSLNKTWTCSGAPILDSTGTLLGVLCISGAHDKIHTHTLGMAISSAASIAKQIQLQSLYEKNLIIKNQLQIIADTLGRGILLVNSDLQITSANQYALDMLKTSANQILKHPVTSIIKNINFSEITHDIENIEVTLTKLYKSKKIFIGVRCIVAAPLKQNRPSFLLTLRETKSVHKIVNNVIGSNAYFQFDDIIGSSASLSRAKSLARIASASRSNVLLYGASGTGKELFAQSIHNTSSQVNGPFIAINCGALPRTLLESELFGYEAGAFTGAKKDGQSGKFELASGGTIFLDEIGDMPFDVQVSLLRVLQNKEIIRIGASRATPIDVRVIAATNKNLETAIKENRFREDLYYRLNVFNIAIPLLSERKDDIIELAYYFINKYNQKSTTINLDAEVCRIFLSYSWPGNIRELENVIERACQITQTSTIIPEDLPQNLLKLQPGTASKTEPILLAVPVVSTSPPELLMTADAMEKDLIIRHLIQEEGNVKRTSDSLGMSRRTLYRKLEKYGINVQDLRPETLGSKS